MHNYCSVLLVSPSNASVDFHPPTPSLIGLIGIPGFLVLALSKGPTTFPQSMSTFSPATQ